MSLLPRRARFSIGRFFGALLELLHVFLKRRFFIDSCTRFFLRTAIKCVVSALGVFLQAIAKVIFGAEYRWSSSRFDSGEIEVLHSNGNLLSYMHQLGQSDLVVTPEQRSQITLGIFWVILKTKETSAIFNLFSWWIRNRSNFRNRLVIS